MPELDALRDRAATGETITADDVTAAQAADALAQLNAEAAEARAAADAEANRLAAIEELIVGLAVEAEAANAEYLATAQAADELVTWALAAQKQVESLALRAVSDLGRLGVRTDVDQLVHVTGGRVPLSIDAIDIHKRDVPAWHGYSEWLRHRAAEYEPATDPTVA